MVKFFTGSISCVWKLDGVNGFIFKNLSPILELSKCLGSSILHKLLTQISACFLYERPKHNTLWQFQTDRTMLIKQVINCELSEKIELPQGKAFHQHICKRLTLTIWLQFCWWEPTTHSIGNLKETEKTFTDYSWNVVFGCVCDWAEIKQISCIWIFKPSACYYILGTDLVQSPHETVQSLWINKVVCL